MKKIIVPALLLVLFSCSEEVKKNDTPVEKEASKTETTEKQVDKEETAEAPAKEESSTKQIDAYISELFKGNVYKSVENVPEDKAGESFYYEELDVTGGYAKISGPITGYSEFAMWRMNGNQDLLGSMNATCGPVCDYEFQFYKSENGKLNQIDLTSIIPVDEIKTHAEKMLKKALAKNNEIEDKDVYSVIYKMPKKGTSMDVILVVGSDEAFVPIAELGWNKEKFATKKKIEDVKFISPNKI